MVVRRSAWVVGWAIAAGAATAAAQDAPAPAPVIPATPGPAIPVTPAPAIPVTPAPAIPVTPGPAVPVTPGPTIPAAPVPTASTPVVPVTPFPPAADPDTPRVRSLPASATLGFEFVRLPAGERMGLVGGSYLLELQPGWWAGPAVYGAATGRRGGLFTWGAEAQRRWLLNDEFGLVAGVYAGGGGGAAAPVGGGLMLRPHVDLVLDLHGWQLGLGVSHVRFPSGDIASTQLGITLLVDDRFAFTPPGNAGRIVDFGGRGGLGADAMHLTVGHYGRSRNGAQALSYVGLRLEQRLGPVWSAHFEAAGAAQGGADGYAEVLGGLSALWPLGTERVRLGLRGSAGLGGGGAVSTGGGAIGKAALAGRLQLTQRLSVDIEGGQARALRNGGFSARYAQVSLGYVLADTPPPGGWGPRREVQDMEWAVGVQHYLHAARKAGPTRSLQAVSLQFSRELTPWLYLTGQAHSAFGGGAGAYSVGLVGLGLTHAVGQGWRVGAEALGGAAGGGGVATQGGAVVQPMAWVSRDVGTYSRVRLAGGYIKSAKGELATPVVELSWGFAFGAP